MFFKKWLLHYLTFLSSEQSWCSFKRGCYIILHSSVQSNHLVLLNLAVTLSYIPLFRTIIMMSFWPWDRHVKYISLQSGMKSSQLTKPALSATCLKLRFRTCVFSCAIRYETVRHVTEKFRHTNKLEGLFRTSVCGTMRYDTIRHVFFIARVCDFLGNLPCGKRTWRQILFDDDTLLWKESRKKSLSKNKWPDLKHWST
jgi:hypothetical protein